VGNGYVTCQKSWLLNCLQIIVAGGRGVEDRPKFTCSLSIVKGSAFIVQVTDSLQLGVVKDPW